MENQKKTLFNYLRNSGFAQISSNEAVNNNLPVLFRAYQVSALTLFSICDYSKNNGIVIELKGAIAFGYDLPNTTESTGGTEAGLFLKVY